MGADSIAYAGHLMANALEHDKPERIVEQRIARTAGNIAVVASVVTGAVSLYQYYKRAFDK